jgi:hypothetical protein
MELISKVSDEYKDFYSLVLDGQVLAATGQNDKYISREDPKIREIMVRYPYSYPLVFNDMIYYSDRTLTSPSE